MISNQKHNDLQIHETGNMDQTFCDTLVNMMFWAFMIV